MELLLLNNAFNLVTTRYNRAVAGFFKILHKILYTNTHQHTKIFIINMLMIIIHIIIIQVITILIQFGDVKLYFNEKN
jgi:hypothetical protein